MGRSLSWLPLADAATVAATHSAELTGLLAGVVPIMGRIAATSRTGAFTQTHTDALHMIAGLPDQQRTSMLRTAPRFLDSPTLSHEQLPRAQRVSLIERLAIHGIRALTELHRTLNDGATEDFASIAGWRVPDEPSLWDASE